MAGFVREVARRHNRFLIRIAFIAGLGGFLFDYDTGVISGAQLYIAIPGSHAAFSGRVIRTCPVFRTARLA
jgi:hypothetical protein